MELTQKKWSWIALLCFTAAVLFLFKDFIFHANSVVFTLGGDGCKNIYSFLYHVKYEGGTWFGGMNYPYGEHLLFTDGQPVLSNTLAFLNKWLHLKSEDVLATMYYLIALSFVLGMWFCYKLITHFGVHPLLATITSIFIIVLSPQWFRIIAHYPLSYVCFLPMLFYWTVQYHETEKFKYLVYILVICTLFAFLHMYFLGMTLLWMLAYVGGYILLIRRKAARKIKHSLLYGGTIILVFAIVQVIIRLTDPIKDRPIYPYTTTPADPLRPLFTSPFSPIWRAAKDAKILGHFWEGGESVAYIGLATLLIIFISLIIFIAGKLKGKEITKPITPFQPIWSFIAITTMLFAVLISSIWDIGMLKELLRPLRQFRAPERFSWIFYYIVSIYASVLLYRIVLNFYRNRKRILAGLTLLITLSLWGIEANGNLLYLRKDAWIWPEYSSDFFSTGKQNWTSFLREKGHSPTDFGAILVVPFVHVGSEKLWPGEDQGYSLSIAYSASLEMHLPIMDVMMSRTSWSQTFDAVKIESGYFGEQPILEKLDKSKPVLLFHFNEYTINPDQKLLFDNATLLGTHMRTDIYAFSIDSFLRRRKKVRDSIETYIVHQQIQDTVIGALGDQIYVQHFDEFRNSENLAGSGSLNAIKMRDSTIAIWNLASPQDSIQYEFSAWSKVPSIGPNQNYYTLIFRNYEDKELSRIDGLGKYSMDNAPGFWFRANKFFQIPAGTKTMEIVVQNPEGDNYLRADELLIRPVTSTVISKFPNGQVLVNNHKFIQH